MMATQTISSTTSTQHLSDILSDVDVRRLTLTDLSVALRRGFEDFTARPTHLFLLGLIYPVAGTLAAVAAAGGDLLPLAYPLVGGYALMGPFVAVILYEISRQREAGQEVSIASIKALTKHPSLGAISRAGLMLLAVFLLWLGLAQAIFDATLGGAAFNGPVEFARTIVGTSAGLSMAGIGNAVGFLMASAVLSLFVVTFPMLLDRDVGVMAAMATSIRVTLASPFIVGVWGFMIAASMVTGSLLFLIGLAVVLPVLGHASWHIYRRAVTIH